MHFATTTTRAKCRVALCYFATTLLLCYFATTTTRAKCRVQWESRAVRKKRNNMKIASLLKKKKFNANTQKPNANAQKP